MMMNEMNVTTNKQTNGRPAKLNMDQVTMIRSGTKTIKAWAKEFNVSMTTVMKAKQGKTPYAF